MGAAETTDAEILILADADVWCDGINAALTATEAGAAWAVPHLKVHRLTPDATAAALAGADPLNQPTECQPYEGMLGGGLVVVRRDVLLEVPFDRRFVGWGREDCAWREAMLTMVGKPWRGKARLIHLWHPPQPDFGAMRTSSRNPTSEALYVRYHAARGHRDQMAALLSEARDGKPVHLPKEPDPMYTYRNRNTGGTVEVPKRRERFDESSDWELIDTPVGKVPAAATEPVDFDVSRLSDEELLAAVDEAASRELIDLGPSPSSSPQQSDPSDGEAPNLPAEAVEVKDGHSGEVEHAEQSSPASQDATDAAIELAEAEKIDLATVTGTGEGGRIVIDDVRKAVEARDGAKA